MIRLISAPLTLLLLSAMLYTSVTPAAACSCAGPTLPERVERSDLILIGEVIAVEPPQVSGNVLPEKTTVLRVERYLKGTGGPEQAINDSAGGDAACGFFSGTPGDIGRRYLIFAHRDGDTMGTSLCSGNISFAGPPQHIAEAAAVEAITGPGSEPQGISLQDEEFDAATKDTPWLIVVPLAFAIPLAFLLIPAFLSKRTPGDEPAPTPTP